MPTSPANRGEIRDFLVTRRARLAPEQVGLPAGGRRRVPGLRREEVAVLSGVSTEWYVRLERGHITGVSEEVLAAVARALQLNDDERDYLFDLARAARPGRRTRAIAATSAVASVDGPVRWFIDSVAMTAVFLRNGRLDVVASNELGRALHAPMFESSTSLDEGANLARFHFLDPVARDFYVDWEGGAAATVALLRAEAGRQPQDLRLRQLIGDLSASSAEFADLWASHDLRSLHEGVKRLRHPVVGFVELTYQSAELSNRGRAARSSTSTRPNPGPRTRTASACWPAGPRPGVRRRARRRAGRGPVGPTDAPALPLRRARCHTDRTRP